MGVSREFADEWISRPENEQRYVALCIEGGRAYRGVVTWRKILMAVLAPYLLAYCYTIYLWSDVPGSTFQFDGLTWLTCLMLAFAPMLYWMRHGLKAQRGVIALTHECNKEYHDLLNGRMPSKN